jgi:ribonucleotide monophosphatase NagD (HAD superfamily)
MLLFSLFNWEIDVTTDIEGGYAVGAKTILTQTGVFNKDKLQSSAVKPDVILLSFSDLMKVIDQ